MPADDLTLDAVLGTPRYYKKFHAYATANKTAENLDFLVAAYAYKKDPSKKQAIAILDKYVGAKAPSELNLGPEDLKPGVDKDGKATPGLANSREQMVAQREAAASMSFFKRHWSAGERKAAENVFDGAIASIRNLVLRDILTRWLTTVEGIKVNEEIQQVVTGVGSARARALYQLGLA